LADASFPKSWPLFGSNARLGFGGYAKLDYIQDFNGMHHDRFEFVLAHIHVPDAGIPAEEPYMNLFARESRFHFDFRTKNKYGTPLQIYLEMDFWNLDRDAFHNVPRLRHFYAVYGDFLVGRTWGLLTNLQAMPNIIDFEGSDAVLISRRAQFRHQPQIKDKLKVGVALEMLEYPDIDGNGFNGQPSMLLPILSTNITRNTKFGGNIMFGGSIYQLRWDGLETGPNTNAIGWGLIFSGRQYVTKKFSFIWNTSAGDGWGTNIAAELGAGNNAIITPEGNMETQWSGQALLGLNYKWSEVLASDLSGAYLILDASEYKADEEMTEGLIGHVNLLWSPVKMVNTGIEYQVGKRINKNGASGVANRVQVMFKFIF